MPQLINFQLKFWIKICYDCMNSPFYINNLSKFVNNSRVTEILENAKVLFKFYIKEGEHLDGWEQ